MVGSIVNERERERQYLRITGMSIIHHKYGNHTLPTLASSFKKQNYKNKNKQEKDGS